ncbi:MAG: hypothetical protein HYT63_02035 [Candidatus Yanofskybacteria bacterium]|nr:hypothetical protein [Candidatus Yanofskybacteria bacterium]
MKNAIVGLKELRENMQKYASLVEKGQSFIVIKKSKPIFKIVPSESEEQWETVIDFTKINKNGVSAKEVLKALRQLNIAIKILTKHKKSHGK